MDAQLQLDVSYRQIWKMAVPISFALLVPQFNFIINNIFLGHLSQEALATASITGVYYLVFSAIGIGLNNGLQMLISRRAGENRPEEIGRLFNQGIYISLSVAAIAIAFTYWGAPALLKSSIHSNDIYKTAIDFLQIRIWGLPFLYIYQMRNALLIGTNQSRYLIAGTLAETVANIFFDYTLIFGKLGLPMLGFNGAAVASVIAEFTGMFVIYLVIKQKGISKRFSLFQKISWEKDKVLLIAHISGPLIFQSAVSVGSWYFFYVLIEHHGQTSLAVSNTMRNIFGFFGVFVWAFANTTNAMVSNIIGQNKKDLVPLLVKKIMLLSCSIAAIVCLLLNSFPQLYLSIYGQDEAFMQLGMPVLRVVAFAMITMSIGTVWLNAVTGTGNSRITFIIELTAIILYSLYVYYVLEVQSLSIIWGWLSEFIYWITLFLLSFLYMKSGKWKQKVV